MHQTNGVVRRSRAGLAVLAMVAGTCIGVTGQGFAISPPGGDVNRADEAAPAGCESHEHGLPFFDIRQDARELPSLTVRKALERWRKTDAYKARAGAVDELASRVRGLVSDEHHTLGTVQFLRSPFAFLTAAEQGDAKDLALRWIDARPELLNLDSKVLANYSFERFETDKGLMHHLTWTQRIGGVEMFGAELRVNVTGRGEIINVGSTIVPVDGLVVPAYTVSALDAIRAASANVDVQIVTDPIPGEVVGENEKCVWERSPELGNQDPVESRKVYFARSREQVVPAWLVTIPVAGPGNTYDIVVDATNGEVLWRHNRLVWDSVQPATYRVYTLDSPAPGSPGTPTPSGFQFPTIARSLVTVPPASIIPYSPNGWIDDGNNTTNGNNVRAYTDAANDNTADPADFATGTAAPGRVFDFPMDLATQAPVAYRDAAITQLFYYSNVFHDRTFALGFDEAARNFQTTNFSGNGVGNDAVLAEAQDGSGTNNANFGTSGTDGSIGRCQMYIWTGPTPDRDGDLDGDIVYHELGHGLSIRLHRGFLTGTQGGGMGEGWSDFWALTLNAEPTDDFTQVYSMGGYATLQGASGYVNNYYFGIRRYPYSVDMTKCPLTYDDIETLTVDTSIPRGVFGSATPGAVHNIGEIWCQTLLECRNNISATEGFGANHTMQQLVMDGMKLIAASGPNLLQERDAIMQADLVRYGGSHSQALWQGFAKRGQGFSAFSPTGGTVTGIEEAFDTPERVDFTYPDGQPSQFLPGQETQFRVNVSPFNLTLLPGTGTISYSVDGGSYTSVAMVEGPANTYTASIPAQPCFSDISYYASVNTSVGVKRDPMDAPTGAPTGQVFTADTLAFSDNFETNLGWTVGPNTATTGLWSRMAPQSTAAQPGADTSNPGTLCFVTDGNAGTGDGSFDVDGGYTTLTSPTINLAGQSEAVVEYNRWYSNSAGGAPGADVFTVSISNNNGSTWTTLELVGPATQNTGGWIPVSIRVADVIAPTASMRFRFVAEDLGTGSLVEAAIDDFRVFTRTCEEACATDYNQDGGGDTSDVLDLANDIASGTQSFPPSNPDFNQDGGADTSDVIDLANAIASGECP